MSDRANVFGLKKLFKIKYKKTKQIPFGLITSFNCACRSFRLIINSICCSFQNPDGEIPNLNLGELDLTTDEFILDEVDSKAALT